MSSSPIIRLSKACVSHDELKEIETVLFQTVNFGLGVHTQQFENDLKKFLATDRDVIAVNTGTSALHIALAALGFPRGSEIIIPSITFVASFSAASAAGLVPVACEVLPTTGHLDPSDVTRRITAKTVAIMPVAYTGRDFARDEIYKIARDKNLRVIEDNAHAFGSLQQDGRPVGDQGDIVCYSFDGIKNITCGEGGAVVVRDLELAKKIRTLRALGIEKDVELRYQGKRAWEYDVAVQGFRYHMSNINAAMGVAQLRRFSHMAERRKKLIALYHKNIEGLGLSDILTPTNPNDPNTVYHIFSCVLSPSLTRKTLQDYLREKGIETGFHYVPNHTHTMYKTSYSLPVAEDFGKRLISLPLHPDLDDTIPQMICKEIADFVERHSIPQRHRV